MFFFPETSSVIMTSDRQRDRKQVTVRLPQEAYDELNEELTAFNTDTDLFRYLVQFYLDYKEQGGVPCSLAGTCETDEK